MNKVLKEFEYKDEKYKLISPSVAVLREAKMKYNKAFTDALKSGFPTRKKLETLFKKDDINILEEHSDRKKELIKVYNTNIEAAAMETDPAQLYIYSDIVSLLKEAIIQEDLSMNTIFSTTADQIAEDEKTSFLVFSLMKKEDLNPIWDSKEKFEEEDRFEFVEKLKYELMAWEYKLDLNNSETPEDIISARAKMLHETALEESKKTEKVSEVIEKPRTKKTTKKIKPSK